MVAAMLAWQRELRAAKSAYGTLELSRNYFSNR
jgi:hypothetical protein